VAGPTEGAKVCHRAGARGISASLEVVNLARHFSTPKRANTDAAEGRHAKACTRRDNSLARSEGFGVNSAPVFLTFSMQGTVHVTVL